MSYQVRQYMAKGMVVRAFETEEQYLAYGDTLAARMGRDKASKCAFIKDVLQKYDDGKLVTYKRKDDVAKRYGWTLRGMQLYQQVLDELEPYFAEKANLDVLRLLTQKVNDGAMSLDIAKGYATMRMKELRAVLDTGDTDTDTDGAGDDVTGDAETTTDRVAAAIAIVQAMTADERAAFDALYRAL